MCIFLATGSALLSLPIKYTGSDCEINAATPPQSHLFSGPNYNGTVSI